MGASPSHPIFLALKGVRSVWKLLWRCLKDQRHREAIENNQAALEIQQEERSERAASKKVMFEAGSGKGTRKKDPGKRKTGLHTNLSELEESDISTHSESDDDEEEEEEGFYVVPLESIRKIKRKEREEQKQKQLESTRRSVTPSAPLSILGSWEQKEGLLSVLEYGRKSERK